MNIEQTAHAIQLTKQLLDDGLTELPYDITERLRAARMQALSQTKRVAETKTNDGFWTWLQRMPALSKSLIVVPVLATALLIGTQIHAPNLDAPSVAFNNVFAPAPVALMQANPAETINIDAILNEKIPLQAYLNDDFNRFVAQETRK